VLTQVPVVDVAPFLAGTPAGKQARQIAQARTDIGFFTIVGHGVSADVVSATVEVTKVPPRPGQLRAGAHTDYGALTVLLPENVPGGLQVQNRLGEWVDVESPSGAFVCNLGDLMQHWTNDRWLSTMHRAVNPARDRSTGNRRVSSGAIRRSCRAGAA
jgi:isopenicillin N synthase-like dioxygenase